MHIKKNNSCCSCSDGCCGSSAKPEINKREIVIDFLYLDVTVCERCQGTDKSLDEAIGEVANILAATGIDVKVNKINARIVSTGIEQYVGGRQTMCKSASPLTADFIVPAPAASSMLHVEPFADYPLVNVFDDGDIVRLAHISLYDGQYNTNECWGTVVIDSFISNGEQVYTFTRSASPNSGSAGAGAVISAGELALNFGVSGDGYIVSTVV